MVYLQVYVRRAYIAYELSCVQHHQLEGGLCVVEFNFLLPSSHPNRFVFSFWDFNSPIWEATNTLSFRPWVSFDLSLQTSVDSPLECYTYPPVAL